MMRKQKILTAFAMVTAILYLQGCYYDKEALLYPGSTDPVDCLVTPATYSADVVPLLTTKCATATCHDAGTASGGVILETYAQVHDVVGRIQQRVIIERTMPPTGPLSPAEINILQCWIQSGAPNN